MTRKIPTATIFYYGNRRGRRPRRPVKTNKKRYPTLLSGILFFYVLSYAVVKNLNVEAEENDVAVFHNVVLAFRTHFAEFLRFRVVAAL